MSNCTSPSYITYSELIRQRRASAAIRSTYNMRRLNVPEWMQRYILRCVEDDFTDRGPRSVLRNVLWREFWHFAKTASRACKGSPTQLAAALAAKNAETRVRILDAALAIDQTPPTALVMILQETCVSLCFPQTFPNVVIIIIARFVPAHTFIIASFLERRRIRSRARRCRQKQRRRKKLAARRRRRHRKRKSR